MAASETHQIERLRENVSSSMRVATVAGSRQSAKGYVGTDTACGSAMACKALELAANKCNYGREGLQAAYEGVNVAAHVMGVVVSLLCGCVYVLGQAVCVLQSVPPVCVFPYNAYSKVFTASVQLWEAVKGATKTCMIHGDVSISS